MLQQLGTRKGHSMNWKRILNYILARLKEPTSWAGIVGAVTGIFHLSVTPDQQAAIDTAGVSVVLAILTFLPNSMAARKTVQLSDGSHASVQVEPAPEKVAPQV
jgi:hypothetical protein